MASLVTFFTGFLAFYSVAHDSISHSVMTTHRNWAIVAFFVLTLIAFWSLWFRYKRKRITTSFLGGILLVFLLVTITAWYGGKLVYRYGIGVELLDNHNKAKNRNTLPADRTVHGEDKHSDHGH